MFSFNASYPIGIDISDRHIHAAQLKESKRGLEITELVSRGLETELEGTPEALHGLLPFLKEVSKNKRFKGKRAVVHIGAKDIQTFPLRFRLAKTERLEAAILRESKEYLPFPLAKAVLDYPSLVSPASEDAGEYMATVVAVKREHIEHYLSVLKKSGLTVEAVDFGVSALIRLHYRLHDASPNPIILCNIGHSRTQLSIVTKESILAHRTVSWGIQVLLRKLLAKLEHFSEEHQAKNLLTRYGLVYEDREKQGRQAGGLEDPEADNTSRVIYQIITPHIEELIFEFHKIMGYVRSEMRDAVLEGIYIYGQGTNIKDLGPYFEKRINIPAKCINPVNDLPLGEQNSLDDVAEGAPFSIAIGLGMRKVSWL